MKLGVFLPISGRAAAGVLAEAARRAEALGFDSVWAPISASSSPPIARFSSP